MKEGLPTRHRILRVRETVNTQITYGRPHYTDGYPSKPQLEAVILAAHVQRRFDERGLPADPVCNGEKDSISIEKVVDEQTLSLFGGQVTRKVAVWAPVYQIAVESMPTNGLGPS